MKRRYNITVTILVIAVFLINPQSVLLPGKAVRPEIFMRFRQF